MIQQHQGLIHGNFLKGIGKKYEVEEHLPPDMQELLGAKSIIILYVNSDYAVSNGDSVYVIHNASKPESKLKKRSDSVCYHYICEAAVAY